MSRLIELIKKKGFKSVFSHWFYYRHLFNNNAEKQVKFIIFGQGRTGSSLLTRLIDQHPKVFCDREIFGQKSSPIFLFPAKYIESNSRKPETKPASIYGFKMKIYQLYTDQKIKNVKRLLKKLNNRGWKFIFLYREDEIAHNVSAFKAFSLGKWVVEKSDQDGKTQNDKLYIDPEQFKKSVLWRRKFSEMERACLIDIPHIEVSYEKDLIVSENHQNVCDRIFEFLGVESHTVKETLKKMNSANLEDSIKNYQEIKDVYLNL